MDDIRTNFLHDLRDAGEAWTDPEGLFPVEEGALDHRQNAAISLFKNMSEDSRDSLIFEATLNAYQFFEVMEIPPLSTEFWGTLRLVQNVAAKYFALGAMSVSMPRELYQLDTETTEEVFEYLVGVAAHTLERIAAAMEATGGVGMATLLADDDDEEEEQS